MNLLASLHYLEIDAPPGHYLRKVVRLGHSPVVGSQSYLTCRLRSKSYEAFVPLGLPFRLAKRLAIDFDANQDRTVGQWPPRKHRFFWGVALYGY